MTNHKLETQTIHAGQQPDPTTNARITLDFVERWQNALNSLGNHSV